MDNTIEQLVAFLRKHDGINDKANTKGKSPPTTSIVERWHKTILHEVYRRTLGKKIDTTWVALQTALDPWLTQYNEEHVHPSRWGYGRTPLQTFLDTIPLAKAKLVAAYAIGPYA